MPPPLTDTERKILDYMVHYLRTNTYQPSIREIGEEFGIKSTKTVSEHLQALASKGYLERKPSRSRGVRILGVDLEPQTVSVPCYRDLPDDRNQLQTGEAELSLSLDRRFAGGKGAYFVRVNDDLTALRAEEGDFLLVEPAPVDEVDDGAIVAVRAGERTPYYRLRRNGRQLYLHSLDADSDDPTVVEDSRRLNLLGRVVGLFRRVDGRPALVSPEAH